jgi:hypothetical protein
MQFIPYFLLTIRAKLPIHYLNTKELTNMSLETLILSVAVLGSLQAAWLVLKNHGSPHGEWHPGLRYVG